MWTPKARPFSNIFSPKKHTGVSPFERATPFPHPGTHKIGVLPKTLNVERSTRRSQPHIPSGPTRRGKQKGLGPPKLTGGKGPPFVSPPTKGWGRAFPPRAETGGPQKPHQTGGGKPKRADQFSNSPIRKIRQMAHPFTWEKPNNNQPLVANQPPC